MIAEERRGTQSLQHRNFGHGSSTLGALESFIPYPGNRVQVRKGPREKTQRAEGVSAQGISDRERISAMRYRCGSMSTFRRGWSGPGILTRYQDS